MSIDAGEGAKGGTGLVHSFDFFVLMSSLTLYWSTIVGAKYMSYKCSQINELRLPPRCWYKNPWFQHMLPYKYSSQSSTTVLRNVSSLPMRLDANEKSFWFDADIHKKRRSRQCMDIYSHYYFEGWENPHTEKLTAWHLLTAVNICKELSLVLAALTCLWQFVINGDSPSVLQRHWNRP